jgi:hypothetical protein
MKTATRRTLAIVAGLALFATTSLANAETCFTIFGGAVNVQFKQSFTKQGYHPATGVIFGSLTGCAGLTHWPVMGAAYTEKNSIVLAFRAETVDAATCGAGDWIANLDPVTLTGPIQLHNDRTNFSNTDTLTSSECVAVPPAGAAIRRPNGKDALGN